MKLLLPRLTTPLRNQDGDDDTRDQRNQPQAGEHQRAGHEPAGAALGNVVAITDRTDGHDREPESLRQRLESRIDQPLEHGTVTASTVATPTIRPTALRSVKVTSLSVSRCSTRVLIGTVFVAHV